MSELNDNKIKERLEVLENDIKRVSEQMVSLEKQQCMSFLNDLNDGDQPTGQEEDSDESSSKSDDS